MDMSSCEGWKNAIWNLDLEKIVNAKVNAVFDILSSCWLIRLCTYYVYMRLCHNLSLHKDMSFFPELHYLRL